MKIKYILLSVIAVILFTQCTEEKEFDEVTPFVGFENSGITELDDKVNVTVLLPTTVNTVEARYFGKNQSISLTEAEVNNQKVKKGSIEIPRADLETLETAGDEVFIHFVVDGNETDLSTTKVQMSHPMSVNSPENVIVNDQTVQVEYKVNPVFDATSGSVSIEYIVNPGMAGSTYQSWEGDYGFESGVITFKGSDFNAKDTVIFKVAATTRGFTSTIKSDKIVVNPLLFQESKEGTLVNDTTYSTWTEKGLYYLDEASAINTEPLTSKVNGTQLVYAAQKVQERKDSVITNDVVYKDVNGEDSIVTETFDAQYLVVKYEKYTATKEGIDLRNGDIVYAGAPVANIIYNNDGSVTVAENTLLISSDGSLYDSKDVQAVKEAVETPATDAVEISGATFTPEPGSFYLYKVDDGDLFYGVLNFKDRQTFESIGTAGTQIDFGMVYKETY